MKKIYISLIVISLIAAILTMHIKSSQAASVSPQFWPIESIDTMKYSRDASRDPKVIQKIPSMVSEVSSLHANYISIATPYDEEFYPVLKAWVYEARKNHLKVWFRGNFSSWEGWFGYPKFTDINQHHILTHAFILKHPDLFEDGDIFTPVPEAENGGMGDPRGNTNKSGEFNQFLVASYNNCQTSFAQINKKILCGFFSMNADIAKGVLTPETVNNVGNIIVIDHYVRSTEQMTNDLHILYDKFPKAKIVLGEYGAPIPDINGTMTQEQQASFINSILTVFYQNKNNILGLNYWVAEGGSTALYQDNGTPKKAAKVVSSFYNPPYVTGVITDTLGGPISNISLLDDRGDLYTNTNNQGQYTIPLLPNTYIKIIVNNNSYEKTNRVIYSKESGETQENIQLTPVTVNVFYKIRLFFYNLFNLQ